MDETEKELYLRYSKASDSAELSRATFDFLPRADVWEHVCLVKGGEDGMRLAFYHNGKKKGEGEKESRFRSFCYQESRSFLKKSQVRNCFEISLGKCGILHAVLNFTLACVLVSKR